MKVLGDNFGVVQTFASRDPDECSTALSPIAPWRFSGLSTMTEFQFEMQVRRQQGLTAYSTLSSSGLMIGKEGDCVSNFEIAFLEAGAQDVRINGSDRRVLGGQAHFIVTDERDRATYFEGTSRYALAMPLDSLVQAAGINAPDPYRQIQTFVPVMSAMDPTIVFLRKIADILGTRNFTPDHLSSNEIGIALVREAFLSMFLATWPRREIERQYLPKPRHVKKAVDWIHAHRREKITLADLATVSGVSVRTLQKGFIAQFGFGPIAYILTARLDGLHFELSRPDTVGSIAEIARRWGFTHMGQLSIRYRQTYGMTMSETRSGGKNRWRQGPDPDRPH